jgi:hypothetical protein
MWNRSGENRRQEGLLTKQENRELVGPANAIYPVAVGDANAKPSASPILNLFGPGHLLLLDLCSTYYSNVTAILLPFLFIVLKFVKNSPVLCVLFLKNVYMFYFLTL